MTITIKVPTPLRRLMEGQKIVAVEGKTVTEIFADLESRYPGTKGKLFDSKTKRVYFSIYLNGKDIRSLKKMETPIKDGDQLSIIPAIAGGRWKLR